MPDCKHIWTRGPFYISSAITPQEPAIFPPRGSTRVEFCTECGVLRLPEVLWKQTGLILQRKEKPKDGPKIIKAE